jgi:flagellar L-ring protein FlgH
MRFYVHTLFVAIITASAVACAGAGASPATSLSSGFSTKDFTSKSKTEKRGFQRHASSLWEDNNPDNFMFTDQKARAIGDVVTVNIIEQSDATGKAENKTDKSSTVGAGVDGLLGFEKQAARRNPNMKLDTLVGAKTATKFSGKGETARSGKLVATMSCLVTDVLPNGNLIIRGQRRLKLNNEEMLMILSGIIRPRDITSGNMIPSTLIADARIEYSGEGDLNNQMRAGWFTRTFEKVWPF